MSSEVDTCPMPDDHRGRLDDGQHFIPARPHSTQRHPKEPVRAGEPRTLDLTVQHAELLLEGSVLKHQAFPVSIAWKKAAEQENHEVFHGPCANR